MVENYKYSRAHIVGGASTKDQQIKEILHRVCKKHCRWYKKAGDNWLNDQWDSYFLMSEEIDKSYTTYKNKTLTGPENLEDPYAVEVINGNFYWHNKKHDNYLMRPDENQYKK